MLCSSACPQLAGIAEGFGEWISLEASGLLYSLCQAAPLLDKSCCFCHLYIREREISRIGSILEIEYLE